MDTKSSSFRSPSTLGSIYSTLTTSIAVAPAFGSIAGTSSIHSKSREQNTSSSSSPAIPRKAKLLNLGFMVAVRILFGMNISLFAPFFPTEAERRGVSTTIVGFVFGIHTFTMFVGSIVGGLMLPKIGIHFMIGSGTLLAGGSTVLFGLLDQAPPGDSYVVLCFCLRIVEGLGASLYGVAVFSIAAVLFKDNISSSYALLESAFGAGAMVGPTLGGALFNAGGFSLPFYVVGAMLFGSGFISQLVLRLTLPLDIMTKAASSDKKDGEDTSSWLPLLKKSYEIWILMAAIALSAMILGYPQPTLALYFQDMGLTDAVTVGFVFLGGALSYTILSLVVGKLADAFPKYHYLMMTLGGALMCLGSLFMGPAPMLQGAIPPSIPLTVVAYIFNGIGLAILVNPTPAAIIATARSVGYEDNLETSTMIASLFNALWYIGSCAGTPVAGALMDAVGFAWGAFIISILGAILTILVAVGALLHWLKNSRNESPFDYARFEGADGLLSSEATLTLSKSSEKSKHAYGSTGQH